MSSNHVIDCGAPPFVPSGWKVLRHDTTRERLHWNPKQIELHLTPSQKTDIHAEARTVLSELRLTPVLNANVLDYLLSHPLLIPKEWREGDKEILFWGTVYVDNYGLECVRSLIWSPSLYWNWESHGLDDLPLLNLDYAVALKIKRH